MNILPLKQTEFKKTQVVQLLKKGEIGIMPTDTVYGIVGSALSPEAVEEIYKLRKRTTGKPMIVLIFSLNDLNLFNIKLTDKQKEFLQKNWPNPLSVVLPCLDEKWAYLHRGTNSLAFRIPKDERLLKILKQAGPLVAPSANLEGADIAKNLKEAKEYFADKISFYFDGGQIQSQPSSLIELFDDGTFKLKRAGLLNIDKL